MSLVPTRAKETFMDLNRPSEGGLSLTKLSDSRPDGLQIPIDGISFYSRHLAYLSCVQIVAK